MKRFLLICTLIIVSVSCHRCDNTTLQQPLSDTQPPVQKKQPYFVTVSFTKFSPIQTPCLEVQIGTNTMEMELDLGFQGNAIISTDCIDKIVDKELLQTKLMYGIRGKAYPTNLYRIPKIVIGKMHFIRPTLQEEGEEFLNDSTFTQDGDAPSPRDPGRLGWELFRDTNVLIDSDNRTLSFCDSLDTLLKHGYIKENFVKTPLLLERGLLEFLAETSQGQLRCMLDTGATWNVLNQEVPGEMPIGEALWEPSNILEHPIFSINGTDFGPIPFHRLPIKIPIQIDALLGMEFFREHVVFVDFSENYIYFVKRQLADHEDSISSPSTR